MSVLSTANIKLLTRFFVKKNIYPIFNSNELQVFWNLFSINIFTVRAQRLFISPAFWHDNTIHFCRSSAAHNYHMIGIVIPISFSNIRPITISSHTTHLIDNDYIYSFI